MCWSGVDIAGDHLATLSAASAQECAAKCELPGDIPSDTAGGDCSLFVFDTAGRCILRRRPFSGAEGISTPPSLPPASGRRATMPVSG